VFDQSLISSFTFKNVMLVFVYSKYTKYVRVNDMLKTMSLRHVAPNPGEKKFE